MRVKTLNWAIALFVLPLSSYLWASQSPPSSYLQIIETQGSFDRFSIGSNIRSHSCVEQVGKNIYISESSPAVIFADGGGQIQEIAVTGPGIFTQRYVSIGQSTMRDVLQRYGRANIDKLENVVVLSYPNLLFFFDSPPSGKSDPLLQTVKFITLRRSPTPSAQTMSFLNLSKVVGQPADRRCDAGLWKHVYHPNRLIVNQQCICVTGTIVDATHGRQPDGVRREPDGDAHGRLGVDPEFQNLLSAGNMSAQDGNLVFEIICRFPVTQRDAKAACQDYIDQVALPPVGSHVRMVGTYVQDTGHEWAEIHPVSNITVVP